MIDPSPELPDAMPIASVRLLPKVQRALVAAGMTTVGEIREAPDEDILQIPDLGQSSLALLRKALALPSSMGVRGDAASIPAKSEDRNR